MIINEAETNRLLEEADAEIELFLKESEKGVKELFDRLEGFDLKKE